MHSKTLICILSILVIFLFCSNALACTGFISTKNGVTLFGNNNDWFEPDNYIRITAPSDEKHGTFIVESKHPVFWNRNYINKCGGVNDQGLAYGKFNTLPWKLPIESFYRKIFRPILELEKYCLEHCSTVEEVIEIYSKYNLFYMFSYQSVILCLFNIVIYNCDRLSKNRMQIQYFNV